MGAFLYLFWKSLLRRKLTAEPKMSEKVFSLKHSIGRKRSRLRSKVARPDVCKQNMMKVVVCEPNASYLTVHYRQTLNRNHPLPLSLQIWGCTGCYSTKDIHSLLCSWCCFSTLLRHRRVSPQQRRCRPLACKAYKLRIRELLSTYCLSPCSVRRANKVS